MGVARYELLSLEELLLPPHHQPLEKEIVWTFSVMTSLNFAAKNSHPILAAQFIIHSTAKQDFACTTVG